MFFGERIKLLVCPGIGVGAIGKVSAMGTRPMARDTKGVWVPGYSKYDKSDRVLVVIERLNGID